MLVSKASAIRERGFRHVGPMIPSTRTESHKESPALGFTCRSASEPPSSVHSSLCQSYFMSGVPPPSDRTARLGG
eukprot:763563-Hanusia_phi.AAC.1